MTLTFKTYLAEASKGSEALDAFIAEFRKETQPNPFLHRMGIWDNSVGFEISKFDNSIHISSVISFDQKNAGNASRGLKWLCDLADKYQVKMDLAVQPMKNAGAREGKNLTKMQLKAWYKRNGFVSTGGDHMMRMPKPQEQE